MHSSTCWLRKKNVPFRVGLRIHIIHFAKRQWRSAFACCVGGPCSVPTRCIFLPLGKRGGFASSKRLHLEVKVVNRTTERMPRVSAKYGRKE